MAPWVTDASKRTHEKKKQRTEEPWDYHGNVTAEVFELDELQEWVGMMTKTEWCMMGRPYCFLDGARSHKRLLDKASNSMTEIRAWLDAHEEEASNAGCGPGLEWVQCRFCGLTDVESAPRHVRTQALQKLHVAHKRHYDERTKADALADESRGKASRAMGKVMRNPNKKHHGPTHFAIQQVMAQAPVTYESSVSEVSCKRNDFMMRAAKTCFNYLRAARRAPRARCHGRPLCGRHRLPTGRRGPGGTRDSEPAVQVRANPSQGPLLSFLSSFAPR
jgi:hypothetical protein